ncbi:thioredoxin family protein [Ramlibacter sp.]|uniref:thioredoxin family protein n=1 Tax=Ramlibacter sp. TaxID=1917967 RepID=UPI0035B45B98
MSTPLQLACLCAAWCRTCDAYAATLRGVVEDLAAEGMRLHVTWIDIEDEADLVGDFDVETFPTLVVIDGADVRFAGAVTPEPATLSRLLRALAADAAAGVPARAVPAEAAAFAHRLGQRTARAGVGRVVGG